MPADTEKEPASPPESVSGRVGDTATISSNAPAPGDTVQEKGAADAEAQSAPAAGQFTVPDGGLEAWLVVAGAWLMMFSTFGYVNGGSALCPILLITETPAPAVPSFRSVRGATPSIRRLADVGANRVDTGVLHPTPL